MILLLLTQSLPAAAPQSPEELWAAYDARKEPLEIELVEEMEKDGVVIRHVLFTVGTFKGMKSRIAAYYGFAKKFSGRKLPGIVWIHGGGQFARQNDIIKFGRRGYACISINWGGKNMNGKPSDLPNTNWGAVNPTQANNRGYSNLAPGELYLDPFNSPRNNNWYLLAVAGRRALTFLEAQKEVDASKLGVAGHSMGGMITVRVATDSRVKAAAPSCGGAGFRTYDMPGMPGSAKQYTDNELFRKSISEESHFLQAKCPIMYINASNDFNSPSSRLAMAANEKHPGARYYSIAPHLNHRFLPEVENCRYLILDKFLKEDFNLPAPPRAEFDLRKGNRAILKVSPGDNAGTIDRVEIYYSSHPNSFNRFWIKADVSKTQNSYVAECVLADAGMPLYAFANLHYKLKETLEGDPQAYILTALAYASPEELDKAQTPVENPVKSNLIDDFTNGWQNFGQINRGNLKSWQFDTYMLNDKRFRPPQNAKLAFEVHSSVAGNILGVELVVDNHIKGRHAKKYYSGLKLKQGWNSFTFGPEDFKFYDKGKRARVENAERLATFTNVNVMGFKPLSQIFRQRDKKEEWKGETPKFRNLRWSK